MYINLCGVWFCIVLYCTVLYCTVLSCLALHTVTCLNPFAVNNNNNNNNDDDDNKRKIGLRSRIGSVIRSFEQILSKANLVM